MLKSHVVSGSNNCLSVRASARLQPDESGNPSIAGGPGICGIRGVGSTEPSGRSIAYRSPGQVVLNAVMEHTSLADRSLTVGVLNSLLKEFPEAAEYYLRQERQGTSNTGKLLRALTQVTRLPLQRTLECICKDPAGLSEDPEGAPEARRLSVEQQFAMVELMSTPQADRSMLQLMKAGVLRPDTSVMRYEGTDSKGRPYLFDLISPDLCVERWQGQVASEQYRDRFIDACRRACVQYYRNSRGVPALALRFCAVPEFGGDPLAGGERAEHFIPDIEGVPFIPRFYNCASLLAQLGSDAGLSAWLTRGYFPIYNPPEYPWSMLGNYSYSDARSERKFLSYDLHIPHSVLTGAGFELFGMRTDDSTRDLRAFGAEVECSVSLLNSRTREAMVDALTRAGIVGLRAEECVELPSADPDVFRIRLNAA